MIAAVPHDYTPACWKSSARSSPLLSYFLLIVGASRGQLQPGTRQSSLLITIVTAAFLGAPLSCSIYLHFLNRFPTTLSPPPPPTSVSLSLSLSFSLTLLAGQDGAVDEDVLPGTLPAERDRLRISKRLDSLPPKRTDSLHIQSPW